MKHLRLVVVLAAVLIAASIGAFLASRGDASRSISKRTADVGDIVAAATKALGTNNVVSAQANGRTLSVKLKSNGTQPDANIARWYGKVLAQVVATQLVARGDAPVSLAVLTDDSGADLNGGSDTIGTAPAAEPLSSGTCERAARGGADAIKAATKSARTIDVLGGACVLIIQPTVSAATFVSDASGRIGSLLSLIPDVSAHPYLVEVVNSGGEVQMVVGWVPGLGGGVGQGIAWVPPGTSSSAIYGSANAGGG